MNRTSRYTWASVTARIKRLRSIAAIMLAMTSSLAMAQVRTSQMRHFQPIAEYAVEFVSTAAFGVAMNDFGDVTGTSYLDTGCGSFCLPPLDTVVWQGDSRIVLPTISALPGIYVTGINNQGWVVGFAGFPYTTTHAVAWKPSGGTYQAIDLGTLPGTTISTAVGIDDLGRVIGWSQTSGFPPSGSPFLWTESTGMVDLAAQGYPDESPVAISPGGTVATADKWYRLGDPSSAVSLAPPPSGYGIGGTPTAINDAGDQARFLVRVSGENLSYLYRYHHEGVWQQLSSSGTGHLSTYGVGSINAARDVSATILSTAVIAYGPNGLAQLLSPLLSEAYQDSYVINGGPMNRAGEILARVLIGQSARLVRLTPVQPCAGSCLRVSDLDISADFIPDPGDPTHDHCYEDGVAHNEALVNLTVTNGIGAPVAGVLVTGRFLDDYWTDHAVSAMTDASGVATFTYQGPCGIGAIAFFVDSATNGNQVLDRTSGVLTGWVIPR
jgi:probable HAF family extracellular repeat protein